MFDQKDRNRRYYLEHREDLIAKNTKTSTARVHQRRRWEKYLKVKCERCGYDEHPEILQFHHRDREEKSFTICTAEGRGKGRARFWQEVLKCDVLCPNCHRWETLQQRISWTS